jgi:hypothetical protein
VLDLLKMSNFECDFATMYGPNLGSTRFLSLPSTTYEVVLAARLAVCLEQDTIERAGRRGLRVGVTLTFSHLTA